MMYQIQHEPGRIRVEFSSMPELLTQATRSVQHFLKESGVCETLDIKLVLRELGTNAVHHGNNSDPARRVIFSVSIEERGYARIEVTDEGDGFDYRSLEMDPPTQFKEIRDRGYKIVRALAERLEFNEAGNKVTVWVPAARRTRAETG
jgi:anti-sigma regulatory factor (Ser/Thr protein kinase)